MDLTSFYQYYIERFQVGHDMHSDLTLILTTMSGKPLGGASV
jgi:hypothetical protein